MIFNIVSELRHLATEIEGHIWNKDIFKLRGSINEAKRLIKEFNKIRNDHKNEEIVDKGDMEVEHLTFLFSLESRQWRQNCG